jgi:hypothetical protein
MQQSQAPDKFLIPFANGAGQSYIRAIPQGSQIGINPGAASLQDGFPPLNFTPVQSGGVPPFGQDMNGILRQITQWSRWQAAGGLVLWDSAFVTAIGGYPRGALLSSTTPGVAWLNIVDNNLTNPDGGTAAGWQAVLTGASVPQTSLVHAGADTSSSAGVITIPNLTPPVSGLANYQLYEIVPNLALGGATSVGIQTFGAVPLKLSNGADPQSGDGPAGQPFLAMFYNGVLVKLGFSASQIAGLVASGPAVTNYLNQNFYAPPGSGLVGSQSYFGWQVGSTGTFTITGGFNASYDGVVLAFSTLNTTVSSVGFINAVQINNISGAADSIGGASTSICAARINRGDPVRITSTCTVNGSAQYPASQYLNWIFVPV